MVPQYYKRNEDENVQVREEPLIATNLVVTEEIIPHVDWFKPVLDLRRELIKADVYYTNTVIFTFEDVEGDPASGKYTYYISLDPIMGDDLVLNFRQEEILAPIPSLYVRCTEIDKLEEMEQVYFGRLLPSFFGFNQFNSFLKSLPFRFSNTEMNEREINDYLDLIKEDIQAIYVYYDYGFTRFNFEHSMPTPNGIDFLLKGKEQWSKDTLLKFEKVNSDLDDLYKQYKPDYDEMRPMLDKKVFMAL